MRRILGAVGVSLLVGGAAALTPFFAALGAAFTLTAVTLAYSVWRWFTRRSTAPAIEAPAERGVR